jgi:hypothetical protein
MHGGEDKYMLSFGGEVLRIDCFQSLGVGDGIILKIDRRAIE